MKHWIFKSIRIAWITCILAAASQWAQADELILCGWDEVFVLKVDRSGNIDTNKVWSWTAADSSDLPASMRDKFRTTDECKPVEGGRKVLIVSSGGGIALVERATKKALFHGFVGNAHSAELLPNDRVVVAGSRHAQGNRLALFDLNRPGEVIFSEPFDFGHGVVWDEARGLLWALGYDVLKAFRLKDWESARPRFESAAVYPLPDNSGHDLVPVPRSDDLIVTSGRKVFLFDREARKFRPHPELGDQTNVKAVTIHPRTRHTVYVRAEGTNWWAGGIRTLHPAGELRLPGERLYKARWNVEPLSR